VAALRLGRLESPWILLRKLLCEALLPLLKLSAVARFLLALERCRLVITSAAVQECRMENTFGGGRTCRHENRKISGASSFPSKVTRSPILDVVMSQWGHAIGRTRQAPGGCMRMLEHSRTSLACRPGRETMMHLGIRRLL
jgi:hypothetical protein